MALNQLDKDPNFIWSVCFSDEADLKVTVDSRDIIVTIIQIINQHCWNLNIGWECLWGISLVHIFCEITLSKGICILIF